MLGRILLFLGLGGFTVAVVLGFTMLVGEVNQRDSVAGLIVDAVEPIPPACRAGDARAGALPVPPYEASGIDPGILAPVRDIEGYAMRVHAQPVRCTGDAPVSPTS